jgi:hypothetical protein
MKKHIALFSILFLVGNIFSQDEYNQPKKKEEENQIRTTKDSIIIVNSQEEKKKDKSFEGISSFRRNLRLGGGVNLSSYYDNLVKTQLTYLGISPQITMILSEYFEGGLTTSYSYLGSFGNVNSHSISAGPVLRAYPFDGMFLQVEGVGYYNTQNVRFNGVDYPKSSTNFNAYVGGGIMSKLSETSYVITGIKVNLLKNSLTYNEIIPVPFTSIHFGLWQ